MSEGVPVAAWAELSEASPDGFYGIVRQPGTKEGHKLQRLTGGDTTRRTDLRMSRTTVPSRETAC